ncbi:HAD-IB family hydrolase [Galbitalea sp. SE-J8]|uniref:HAD family hydrolase n=1 Tax=Galbitalea sp. SE-J8 TaxID=3054952 RepID=UPI00259C9DD7|nr:HAD-IB family hydrolase [Galbitalea sp. SE-J8]MDM4762382.1 HAD-IB family hydrolase [Galbitalea sp. SE-J8]
MPDDDAPTGALDAVPPSDRPIIAFFDVDNTLLRGASIFHIGAGAFRKRLIRLRDIALFGWHQLSFLRVGENAEHLAVARDRALELVGGHPVADLVALTDEIFDRTISRKLWPESVELAREHLAKGHEVWLVTATPQIVAQVIADRLGLTGALGTLVEEVDGLFTGRLVGTVMHGAAKADAARALALSRDAALEDCWAYSDSKHDIPLLTLTGHRVVVNPDAALAAHASEHGWPIMRLKLASIREARRRVRREARAVRRSARNP